MSCKAIVSREFSRIKTFWDLSWVESRLSETWVETNLFLVVHMSGPVAPKIWCGGGGNSPLVSRVMEMSMSGAG